MFRLNGMVGDRNQCRVAVAAWWLLSERRAEYLLAAGRHVIAWFIMARHSANRLAEQVYLNLKADIFDFRLLPCGAPHGKRYE